MTFGSLISSVVLKIIINLCLFRENWLSTLSQQCPEFTKKRCYGVMGVMDVMVLWITSKI